MEKEAGKRKRVDLTVSKQSAVPENSDVVPEKIFLPPKENASAFQKAYKTFDLPNNDRSLGIKEFLLLRKEETICIFRNELKAYKALKLSKWEANLVRLYDNMSEKIVKESEDFEDDQIKYLMDLDANNLYSYAMSKYLPLNDFVWSDNNLTEQDILNLSDESDVGYILEVDLEYPSDLHDKHSDFPLAPENKPPPNCKEPRLLTTLEPKTKYVLHYSNLKLYLKLGDMKDDINLYDTSDYDENNIYNLPLVNKKVIVKMKDENKGNIMTEYVGLKSKMYAYKTNNKIEKRLKGIKKQTIKNKITFEDYKACLFNEKIKYVDMNFIRSKFHSLYSIKQNKLALSYKDDKRNINDDGITTLAHGHWSLMNLDLFNELYVQIQTSK
ncbi:uncharacterized protein TNCV_5097981 [Trichonephila clavipes]|uniref:Uncharacterized protein n=1 Tax=Trichonephila clavipes TaxID=2585209 RepID=A0A8X6RUB2_TRICX|nr:uncharacterized protein TNCV_5097981 [Trichonephila clavipes]